MDKNAKRYKTPGQLKEEILKVFPEGTGELFYKLWTNVAHAHLNWKNYRSLFGTSPERVDLLRWAASSFFFSLDGILRRDIMLAITRLTDPPQTAGKNNASLARLIEILNPHLDQTLADELRSELRNLQSCCESVRKIRNRLLAHNDLATALQYHPDPLPGISRADIEEMLKRIRELLGDIEKHFRGSTTSHQYVISSNDGESLIFALESAREHEKCRQREFNQKYGIRGTGE